MENELTSKLRNWVWQFCIATVLLLGVYSFLCYLGQSFAYGASGKPIRLFVGALTLATLVSWFAIHVALKIPRDAFPFFRVVFVFAVIFRGEMMFSEPILEIDFYRYLWDGKVGCVGESPYRFSPAEVLADDPEASVSLQRLSALACQTESNHTILSRVHFKDYTTIYPPVSQAVFASVMRLVPGESSVLAHLLCLRLGLVFFDLGTMACVAFLIRKFAIHPAWLIAYGWNPLVIKEIANSAHLDSIAVFFMVAAVTTVTSLCVGEVRSRANVLRTTVAGLLLALGVGSKLFPVILFPAVFAYLTRWGWKTAAMFAMVFFAGSIAVLWPYIEARRSVDLKAKKSVSSVQVSNAGEGNLAREITKQKEGLSGFLTRWRMNDAIFSFVYYNCRPEDGRTQDRPWLVFVPNSWRMQLGTLVESLPLKLGTPAYAAARIITLGMFTCYYLFLLKGFRTWDARRFLEVMFLLIAFFLLFQPTQNPWYWVWALPLVCFVKNRGWLVVTAVFPIYYSRFWFKKLETTFSLGGVEYTGTGFFDHIVVWFELATLVGVLLVFWLVQRKGSTNHYRD